MTKAELLKLLEEVPMERKIVFEMGHLAEVGDLLEPAGIDETATIDSTVIMIGDPYWAQSAYNTEPTLEDSEAQAAYDDYWRQ